MRPSSDFDHVCKTECKDCWFPTREYHAELNGGTHMSMEDIGVMRSIPGMVIFEPVDCMQLAKAMPEIVKYDGPLYIRLFRKAAPIIFDADYKFDLFKADMIEDRIGCFYLCQWNYDGTFN